MNLTSVQEGIFTGATCFLGLNVHATASHFQNQDDLVTHQQRAIP